MEDKTGKKSKQQRESAGKGRERRMKADKRTGLKQAYYQSFFALIVVPILTVILVSVGIIRATLSESSVDRIRQAQDNLASTLGKEVKDCQKDNYKELRLQEPLLVKLLF